jgi:hypothetical protein
MKYLLWVVVAALPLAAAAAKKPVPLTADSGAALAGKTIVVTRHEKPSFVAMTAGKAGFALIGFGAMVAAGNKIIADNEVADPADILERELVPAVAKHYNFTVKAGPSPVIKGKKPKEIAATQTEGDYILDLQSIGWQFAYYPTDWNSYWTAYSVQVQLIERASARVVSNVFCNANNNKHPASPSKESLLENKAQLLKDVTTNHGWACVHVLAKDQFLLPEGAVAAIPAEYADPLAAYKARGPGAPAPAATTVAAPAEAPAAAPAE